MEPFDIRHYIHSLEESRRRISASYDFEEADRVPVTIGLGGPYYAWLFGRTLAEYYNDLAAMLDTQIKGIKWRLSSLGDDVAEVGAWLDVGSIAEGVVFECEIRMPDETNPWMSPWIIPCVKTLDDIDRFEVPDPSSTKQVKNHYERLGRFKELVKENYENIAISGGLQIHPPISAAGSLLGPGRLYSWLYEYPNEMHKLFRKLVQAFKVIREFDCAMTGAETGSLHLSDDHAGYLNREQYRKFALPYNLELYRLYGPKQRSLHMDSHMDHITDIVRDIYEVKYADVGVENDIEVIARAFRGRIVFNGNADWRVLVNGSLEAIEREVEKCVFHSARGGGYIFDNGGETYVGVPPDKLKYEVSYVKKVGQYPIMIDRFRHIQKQGKWNRL